MKNKSCCPKCGEKLSPFYMKQTCPKCSVNLLYYKLDERLEADAKQAKNEVDAVNRFTDMLKASTIKTPWHIIRLILFFTPLASMCLPMFWAGHKKVSLIAFILSIVNHGFDFASLTSDKSYLFAILAMVGVIVFSLAVIISSLFSATKKGFRRNIIFSVINTAVLSLLSLLVYINGGALRLGFAITMLIYALEFVLHYICAKPKNTKRLAVTIASAVACVILMLTSFALPKPSQSIRDIPKNSNSLRIVSFNLASPWGTGIDDTSSENRVQRFADYMKAANPDIIGTQELNSEWLDKLGKLLPEYESYAVKRGGDSEEKTSEMNGIFWKKDAFTAMETNTFWLSQTPKEESRFIFTDENGETEEAGCNRICSYAILMDNQKNLYAVFNTHLDNSSEKARNYGVTLIMQAVNYVKAHHGDKTKIILTGDFNQTSDSEVYKTITKSLTDSQLTNNELKATYQEWGYRDTGTLPIDFIFVSNRVKVSSCGYLDDLSEGYVSDHYGIYSDIQ